MKKKNLAITLIALVDIMVIVMVIVVKNTTVIVSEEKTNNIAAANILVNGSEGLDQYKNQQIIEKPEIVYDNMTLEQLSNKLNNSLKSTMSGKGELIASYALQKGVDPYIATSIILLETGCASTCSTMVITCNNVGGQKGSGCGAYQSFATLDEGIIGFIDNLYKNYFSRGLTTPETIGPKYAESPQWSVKVNRYINYIKTH